MMTFEQILIVTFVVADIIVAIICVRFFIEAFKTFRDEYRLFVKMINLIAQSYKETFGENSISEVSILLDDLKKHFEDRAKNG